LALVVDTELPHDEPIIAPSGRNVSVSDPLEEEPVATIERVIRSRNAELESGDVLLASERTNWERRERVAAMHHATFPAAQTLPPAAAVHMSPASANVREVPPIAGPHPTLTLWEGISASPIRFHTDQGSAFTVLREAEVRTMGLLLEAVSDESGSPHRSCRRTVRIPDCASWEWCGWSFTFPTRTYG
jgi:hypothetical protein